MMKKSLINKLIIFATCLGLLMFSLLFLSLNPITASAESGFAMASGASVRTDTPSGIRYKATISASSYDADAEYGMLIVPTDYLTSNNITEDYFAKLEAAGYTEDKLAVVESTPVLKPDGSYEIYGSIVNIVENNFNRAFTGIAFSVKDGNYTYATSNDNSRTIMSVAERYLTAEVDGAEEVEIPILMDIINGSAKVDSAFNALSINAGKKYLDKIKFDAYLQSGAVANVSLVADNEQVAGPFALSVESDYQGITRAELGNDWYSFTISTQALAENTANSDVFTAIEVGGDSSDSVILANARCSELKIAKYSDAYAGSSTYFGVQMSGANDADGDSYSIKVTAKAHSDSISPALRPVQTAIYIPYSGNKVTNGVATLTWKAKIDKNSFVGLNGDSASGISYSTNFYKNAMLTQNTAFFGTNSTAIAYSAEDANGWITYTVVVSEADISKFFVENEGKQYIKLVCMNSQAALLNNGNWTSPTSIGYEFYVDDFAISVVNGEFIGAYTGNSKYMTVAYSNDQNFVTGSECSLKVTANAVAYGAVDGSGATGRMANLAIYLPYGKTLPTTDMTVTWKVKLDRTSFVDCDETQGVGSSTLNSYCSTFLKAGLLSVNTAAYETTTAELTVPSAEDANGWYNYSLSIPSADISKIFVQGTDGNYYLRLVCLNVGPALSNNSGSCGTWAAASTMGYSFYVDELAFNANA